MKTFLALAVLGFVAPLAAQEPPASTTAGEKLPTTMLRLRSGAVLWGSILGDDPTGIAFQRLDTLGKLHLAWSFLDPAEERNLRLRYGYADEASEEIQATATRILLADGSEVVGRVLSQDDEFVWVKRAEGSVPIPRARISGTSSVRVPALDLFTRDELYQDKATELGGRLLLAGASGAAAHSELAAFAERLLDFAHALEHWRTAQALDPAFDRERAIAGVQRTAKKAALAAQIERLSEIELLRLRQRYDKAIPLLEAFANQFPDTPLLEDLNDLRERIQRSQERDLRETVVARTYALVVTLATRASRQKPTYEEVIAYLDEQMTEELWQAVLAEAQRIAPEIGVEQVQRMWNERSSQRWRTASYGLGTWLLGEERALGGLAQDGPTQDPAAGSAEEARAKLEERFNRYLRNQELARKSRAQDEAAEEDPNEFWTRELNGSARAQWLLAYFVENSELFQLGPPRFTNCRDCGGTGARDLLFLGGAWSGAKAGSTLVPCPTCHHLGKMRRVRFR
jgi:hypothetical protein